MASYTDLTTTFVYKGLLTWQQQDALAENDAMMVRTDLGGQTVTQSQADEWGLKIYRDKAEVGTYALLLVEEDNGASTQPVIEIDNDGAGEEIKFTHAVTRYYVVSSAEFQEADAFDFVKGNALVKASAVAAKVRWAGVHLPHNAIVTAVKMYYLRFEGVISVELVQGDNDGTVTSIVTVTGDSVAGTYVSKETSGLSATIDDSAYQYFMELNIDPVDNVLDCAFLSARISYTITEPLS